VKQHDDFTNYIEWLTRGVRALRILRYGERNDMALELKGLKGKAIKAAGHLDRLNAAYDAFNTAAPIHATDVESLTPQITALQDDLAFATQVLGNSANGSPESPPAGPAASTEPVAPGDATKRDVFNG
jgi:hypothetical protein